MTTRLSYFLFKLVLALLVASSPLILSRAGLAQVNAPASPSAPTSAPAPAPSAPVPPREVPGDEGSVQNKLYQSRPVAMLAGKSSWEEGFQTLTSSFAKIRAGLKAAGLAEEGPPLAVFLETDDDGFKFEAMVPVGAPPAGGVQLGNGIRLTTTPNGQTLKFQHRGAYDDIDSTYEAITAYLDEKGLNAANVFIEEYIKEAKTPDDNELAVDIYVFLK